MVKYRDHLGLDRLKGLSDGFFSIVITIMVLGLEVPSQEALKGRGILGFFAIMEHQFRPYAASFATLAALWLTQVVILHYIDHANRTFVWLNLVFFFLVSVNPFLTDLAAKHVGDVNIAWIYSGFQSMDWILLLGIWHYAITRLRDTPPSRDVVRSFVLRVLGAVACYIIGAALTPVSVRLAMTVCVCVPLLFLVHRKIDAAWLQQPSEAGQSVAAGPG